MTTKRLLANAPLNESGWVGSVDDLKTLVALFRDLERSVRTDALAAFDSTQDERRAEFDTQYSFLDVEKRVPKFDEQEAESRQLVVSDIEVTLSVSEDLDWPADDPQEVIAQANMTKSTSFVLELSAGYHARRHAKRSSIRLAASKGGVVGQVTSLDRQFIEASRSRIQSLLQETRPRRRWLGSWWFATIVSTILSVGLGVAASVVALRIWPGDAFAGTAAYFVLYLPALVASQIVVVRWLFKQFERFEIYASGSSSKSAIAARSIRNAAGWVVTAIAVPILLAVLLPS